MSSKAVAVAAIAAATVALAAVQLRRRRRRLRAPVERSDVSDFRALGPHLVPERLRPDFYFDLAAAAARGCAHAEYLRSCSDVSAALDGLHDYIVRTIPLTSWLKRGKKAKIILDASTWLNVGNPNQSYPKVYSPERVTPGEGSLLLEPDARLEGGVFDLGGGSIYIGAGAVVELGAYVRGPAHIGAGCVVRHGAYIRGDVALGAGCVVGGEIKHALCLDGCELPHHGYVGDSLLGHKAHFGCGAVTANFPLFPGSVPSVQVEPGHIVSLGRQKFGAVVGDHSQLGCGTVSEPGCLIAPQTHCYPLCRLPHGVYGPNEVLKNRTDSLIERAPFRAAPRPSLWARATGWQLD